MKLDFKFIKKYKPCFPSRQWLSKQPSDDVFDILEAQLAQDRLEGAEWVLTRCLDREHLVTWACDCAESVLHVFEKEFPDDARPRNAIMAVRRGDSELTAKACLLSYNAHIDNCGSQYHASETAYLCYMLYDVYKDHVVPSYSHRAARCLNAQTAYGSHRPTLIKRGIELLKEQLK